MNEFKGTPGPWTPGRRTADCTTDCRTDDGVTVGLIDALIDISRVLAKRDMSSPDVTEALLDLRSDEDVARIYNRSRPSEPSTMPAEDSCTNAMGGGDDVNDKTGISAGLIEARYPCEQCNMDDGSPVCLQDMRCPKRSQRTNDKTDTEPLATALGILAQEASQRDDHGDAEILAKASLRLHDKSEEIERLKAEISVLKDAVHYANGTAELAIRHRDEAEARAERAKVCILGKA